MCSRAASDLRTTGCHTSLGKPSREPSASPTSGHQKRPMDEDLRAFTRWVVTGGDREPAARDVLHGELPVGSNIPIQHVALQR